MSGSHPLPFYNFHPNHHISINLKKWNGVMVGLCQILWSPHFLTFLKSELVTLQMFGFSCHPFIPLDCVLREAARGIFSTHELYYITSSIQTNQWPLIIRTVNSKLFSLAWSLQDLASGFLLAFSVQTLLCTHASQRFDLWKWQTHSFLGPLLCWLTASARRLFPWL